MLGLLRLNEEIYQYILLKGCAIDTHVVDSAVRALQKLLPANTYALDFDQVEYDKLIDLLMLTYPKEELLQKKGAIKKAICDYFALSYQNVTLSILESGIVIKKEFIDPHRDENFDRLMHRLNIVLMAIDDNPERYRQAGVLWVIPDRLRQEMFALFGPLKIGEEPRRNYLRQQLELIFKLDKKDIILFLLNRIYIREYRPPSQIPEGAERRFTGEPSQKMEELFESAFPEGLWEDIAYCLPAILENELNFSVIDNRTFSQKFIQTFRSMIDIILLECLDGMNQQLLEGLTGYVLRSYFDKILIYTAENLLDYVEIRDLNAETFVKYFTDEIIIDANGKKTQKYAIIDARGQKWNYRAIMSGLMQYKQAKRRAELQKEKILQAAQHLEETRHAITSAQAEHDRAKALLDNIKNLITENKMKVHRARQKDKSGLADLQAELTLLIDEQKKVSDHYVFAARHYNNKTTELKNREKQLNSATLLLKEINQQDQGIFETYTLIAHALAAALAKR